MIDATREHWQYPQGRQSGGDGYGAGEREGIRSLGGYVGKGNGGAHGDDARGGYQYDGDGYSLHSPESARFLNFDLPIYDTRIKF